MLILGMDALIRLDVLMPIVPLTESVVIPNPTNNSSIPKLHQESTADVNSSINEVEIHDFVEFTVPATEGLRIPTMPNNTDKETTNKPYPETFTSVDHLDEEMDLISGTMQRTLTKHKLPPTSTGNHSPSKVSRIIDNDISVAMTRPKIVGTINMRSPRPTSTTSCHYMNNCSTNPASSVMKNHTVTSADFNNSLQFSQLASNKVDTSYKSNTLMPSTNRPNTAGIYVPSPSLSRPHDFHNSVVPQNSLMGVNEVDKQGGSDPGREKKDSAMFYQLLDMFPDIDLKFLENHCRLGLDVNQVSEIILEMNDYPKGYFQTSQRKTPEVSSNLNVNNSNISKSCTSLVTATDPGLADKEVNRPVLCDDKDRSENLFSSKVPDSSVLIISNGTKLEDSTQICGIKNEESESNHTTNHFYKPNVANQDRPKRNKQEIIENNNSVFGGSAKPNPNQSQLNFLMEIFPDADPNFLVTKSELNKNELRHFIAESMENNDYPKIKDCVKIESEVEDESIETGLYTSNFNLENFIKIFPDPFGYFLDDKRKCQYTEHGFGFLKRRYRCHAVKIISSKYKEFNYNLVKTSEFLDAEKPSRITKRGLNEIKIPEVINLPFLQEACFIEHKTEIKKHLDGIAELKRLAYEQAEEKGELIECECCYQSVLFEDCATCNEGHLFCKSCIRKSVEIRIGDAHTTFPCLQDCDSVFSLQLLEALVDPTMFSRLLQRIQLDEVKAADIEGLEGCPFCDFAIILPPETSIFKCLNPECLKESCRKCHKQSHIPQRCEELESDDQARARKYIEDEMTMALVRVCYKCKKSFIKTDGCNKMTCTCGAKMCYICREPIVDYQHFNGPGGEMHHKCPLYSTDKLLHVDAVEAVAKKALEEVTSKNPELKLKHDPSKILPTAGPAKSALPPGVNEDRRRIIHLIQNIRQMNDRLINNNRRRLNNNIIPIIPLPAPPRPQGVQAARPPEDL